MPDTRSPHSYAMSVLEEVSDFLDDYADSRDGGDGRPLPNEAMLLQMNVRECIGRLKQPEPLVGIADHARRLKLWYHRGTAHGLTVEQVDAVFDAVIQQSGPNDAEKWRLNYKTEKCKGCGRTVMLRDATGESQ